ncbi:MAG: glycosyltransferase [Chloroflexi bacterium]|nr:glycosyltransferase [Chloroflexota bacterium]
MKIMHLITGLNTGGAEVSLYRLLGHMDHSRFENRVISLILVGEIGEKIRALGIPVTSLGLRPGQFSLGALWSLVRELRSDRPDILQTWMYHADLLGLLAAKLSGIQQVVWNIRSSNMDTSQYRKLTGLVIRLCSLLSGLPRAVIVNSHAGQEFHTDFGYHPRRWVLIPNGMDLDRFHPDEDARFSVRAEFGLDLQTVVIGMLGRYDPMKGHTDFLHAAGLLIRSGVDAHFLLAGQAVSPDNETLKALILEEGLAGRVHLLGQREDIYRLDAALDILAMSSVFGEGFPNVVAEAMACGVPCAVTDVGDAASLVADTGRVVPPRDPAAMADAWMTLVRSGAEYRHRLGESARRRVVDNFSIEKTVITYEALYSELTASK